MIVAYSLVRRGLDSEGNAANSVEMEQICFNQNDTTISSFVQLRGSAPLIWSQRLNSSYKPDVKITGIEETWASIHKHFVDLKSQYTSNGTDGNVICVNLLDDRGFGIYMFLTHL